MVNQNQEQLKYWENRAKGEVKGLKSRILSRFFRTGYVGINRLREYRCVLRNLVGVEILDAGCGDGAFLAKVKKGSPNHNFTGIDFSPSMVKIANARGLNAKVMDMQKMVFEDQSFDTSYCVRSLKNLTERDAQASGIGEICRITGSRVIIFDSFEGNTSNVHVPEYNLPLDIEHLIKAFNRCHFELARRMFFPSSINIYRTSEEQVSHYGCLIFDRYPRQK